MVGLRESLSSDIVNSQLNGLPPIFIWTTLIKLLDGSHTEKGHVSKMESCWEEERIQQKKEGLRRKLGVKNVRIHCIHKEIVKQQKVNIF